MDTISLPEVRILLEAGALQSVEIVGENGAFKLRFFIDSERPLMVTQRGNIRSFRDMNTVIRFLKDLGICHGTFDIEKLDHCSMTAEVNVGKQMVEIPLPIGAPAALKEQSPETETPIIAKHEHDQPPEIGPPTDQWQKDEDPDAEPV